MELRHLRYFIAVAEEGNITRAAERLGMQQPPLSQRIKAIERELDVQLFRRKARGVELTEAGRAFLDSTRAMLAQFDHAFETTRRAARGEQGRISVGITPSSPFHPFVPHVIRAFREAFPLVSLTLEECPSNELVEHLRNEQVDAAFFRTIFADPQGLVVDHLMDEILVVALPTGHALAQRDGDGDAAISLKALASETFITQTSRYRLGLHASTIAACHAAGFTPRIGPEASRLASTLNFVAVGLGISLVPASLQAMQIDGVTYRRLKGLNQPKLPLDLASRRGDSSVAVQNFLKLVKQAAKNFPRNDSVGTLDRITAVLREGEDRTDFVRDAVERELQRREAKQRLAKVKRRLQQKGGKSGR
jgi:DNA-binding transcriptional LysR family regulator